MAGIYSASNGYYTLDIQSDAPERRAPFTAFLKVVAASAAFALGLATLSSFSASANLITAPSTAQRVTVVAQPIDRPAFHQGQPLMESSAEMQENGAGVNPAALAATTAMVNLLGPVPESLSADLIKGRTAALVHPASMFAMLALSLYAGWLGLQWKRARTIGQEITDAKNEATAMAGRLTQTKLQGTGKETLAALKAAGQSPSPADLEVLNGIIALEQKAEDLAAERKTLTAGNFRDRHFNAGSLLLAVGVGSALIAPANTYIRTGKLFPGPHLYIGAAMVSLWAVAAALVPAMQKGNETARSIHVALNAINIAFFVWQVGTGIEIIGKVLQFTSWP